MQKHRCIIVDDEELGRDLVAAHLQQLEDFEVVASCASAIEASRYLNQNEVDLIFLDIEMPVLKGTDFYKGLSKKPKVIFTTAYRDYAVDGFDLEAVDYLLKPITFARFFKAIERYLEMQKRPVTVFGTTGPKPTKDKDHIFIRVARKEVKLQLDDILYVKGLKDYLQIFTQEKTYTVKETITQMDERLGKGFLRVHRSYLVNMKSMTAFTKHDVEIGEIEIPIGETYRQAFLMNVN